MGTGVCGCLCVRTFNLSLWADGQGIMGFVILFFLLPAPLVAITCVSETADFALHQFANKTVRKVAMLLEKITSSSFAFKRRVVGKRKY